MNLHTWWLFVATVFVVSAIPGPNMLLVMTHGARHGLRRSSATMAGCLTALVLMLSVSAAGLGVFLEAWPRCSTRCASIGAAYLVWLGHEKLAREGGEAAADVRDDSRRGRAVARRFALFRNGFLVASSNPKSILFAAALLPQFIDASRPTLPQFGVLVVDIRRDRSELVSALRGSRHADRREAEKRERRAGVQPADGRRVRRLRRDDGAGAPLTLAVAVGVAARRTNGGRRTVHRAGARLAPDWGVSFAFEHTFARSRAQSGLRAKPRFDRRRTAIRGGASCSGTSAPIARLATAAISGALLAPSPAIRRRHAESLRRAQADRRGGARTFRRSRPKTAGRSRCPTATTPNARIAGELSNARGRRTAARARTRCRASRPTSHRACPMPRTTRILLPASTSIWAREASAREIVAATAGAEQAQARDFGHQ